jgi:hypothetical protein
VIFDLDTMDCIIENIELHYSYIIDSCGILITNSIFTIRKQWRADVLNTCKNFGRKRIKTEVEIVENNILKSEEQMYLKMNKQFEKK